jgi:uncharacterized protein (UPF0335 family)
MRRDGAAKMGRRGVRHIVHRIRRIEAEQKTLGQIEFLKVFDQ